MCVLEVLLVVILHTFSSILDITARAAPCVFTGSQGYAAKGEGEYGKF